MEVGLREANQRFSTIIKEVRSGKEVMLTERGKPFARLVPVRPAGQPDAAVRQLGATGLLRAAANPRPMPAWVPRPIRGASMAQTLRKERESPRSGAWVGVLRYQCPGETLCARGWLATGARAVAPLPFSILRDCPRRGSVSLFAAQSGRRSGRAQLWRDSRQDARRSHALGTC